VTARASADRPRWGGRHAQALTRAVLARDGYRCQIPGPTGVKCLAWATTGDHIVPRALGGPDSLANMRAACGPCNFRAGQQLARYLADRKLRRRYPVGRM
jgi:5-methylcytosine-specific restriction endonuclease McrA